MYWEVTRVNKQLVGYHKDHQDSFHLHVAVKRIDQGHGYLLFFSKGWEGNDIGDVGSYSGRAAYQGPSGST